MSTFVVWVLALNMNIFNAGGPLVIDNIATQGDCEALARDLQASFARPSRQWPGSARCVAVRKSKP